MKLIEQIENAKKNNRANEEINWEFFNAYEESNDYKNELINFNVRNSLS